MSDVSDLYDAHADLVWRCLHRLGVAEADLPDLLHDVFLVVHKRRDELTGERPIEPFLWGVSLGLVRNYRRRAFRRLEVVTADADAASNADPEENLIRRDQQRRLEHALDALDVEKRAVFVMFELESMSGQLIADALAIPIGTVHSRLFAARRELAASLSNESRRKS